MPPKAKNNDIQINLKEDSSLAEFTKRPVPNEKELDEFEDYVENASEDQNEIFSRDDVYADNQKEEEIEESLTEIYQDDKAEMVDVHKLSIKRKRGFVFWFLSLIILGALLTGAGYFGYNYLYLKSSSDSTSVDFKIEGKTEVMAGEEFFYTMTYVNNNIVPIKNVVLELNLPQNFIFLDSFPAGKADKNNVWEFGSIEPNTKGEIKIKGMMMGKEDETGVVLATFRYVPENFSSEFKKDFSQTTTIKGTGINFDFDYLSNVLVGEEEEIAVHLKAGENNHLDSFRLTFEPQENIKIIGIKKDDAKEDGEKATWTEIRPGVWDIANIGEEESLLPVVFSFTEKKEDKQAVVLNFEKISKDDKFFKFYSKTLEFEIMKSDLNLAMIINGSRDDAGVNLGDKLNYTIAYSNRGETEMKDLVIMAVLEGDFLDWETLEDGLGGKKRGNTIIWSKEEIPGLEALGRNQDGEIIFSIEVLGKENFDDGADTEIKSYARYSVGEMDDAPKDDESDNRSNTIINKINSNLSFREELRYFSAENIPVGTGKHPPAVGEETTYKVYWSLNNTLHELEDLQVSTILPSNVRFAEKENFSVGNISYNANENKVIWYIGRLPNTVHEANAEFSIGVTPAETDQNKIMVLLSGSRTDAIDSETKAVISESGKAKTTKLEDDEIGGGDGIVE